MTLDEFLAYVKKRIPLDTEEVHRFMDKMSDEARRITFELNTAYHTPDEVRLLLSRLLGYDVDASLRVFPPSITTMFSHCRIYFLIMSLVYASHCLGARTII